MNSIIPLGAFFITLSSSIVILFFLIRFISAYARSINASRNCSQLESILSKLEELIETNVISINQTVVNTLKEEKAFSQIDKEEAFESCKEKTDHVIKETDRDFLYKYIGNLDEWIKNRIEYYVRLNKTNKT